LLSILVAELLARVTLLVFRESLLQQRACVLTVLMNLKGRVVTDDDWLAERFEENRPHLQAVAYRMLGSLSEADDAVQESWLRLSRSNAQSSENLGGWLTTVVARVCLNLLRSRDTRREEPLGIHLPDPIVNCAESVDPEQAVLLADSIGLALLVILETLEPDERLAFVLHDMFAVPFDEIASIIGRTPVAARQLVSRARRRVQGSVPVPDANLARQREVVDPFLTAARAGDFERLVAVLDPDVVLHADRGAVEKDKPRMVRGARAVAEGALLFARLIEFARPALVNGAAGVVVVGPHRQVISVLAFTVAAGKVAEIDILLDPVRLRRIDVSLI
jgi:RNA polymerase sigma-70 factor (ECF subfamily)